MLTRILYSPFLPYRSPLSEHRLGFYVPQCPTPCASIPSGKLHGDLPTLPTDKSRETPARNDVSAKDNVGFVGGWVWVFVCSGPKVDLLLIRILATVPDENWREGVLTRLWWWAVWEINKHFCSLFSSFVESALHKSSTSKSCKGVNLVKIHPPELDRNLSFYNFQVMVNYVAPYPRGGLNQTEVISIVRCIYYY